MSKVKNRFWYAAFTLPLLIIFVTVVIIPFISGVYYAFFDWNGVKAFPKVFVGFENFAKLFGDKRFLHSAWITIKFTLLAVVSVNVLGLAFALLVTSKIKVANLSRSLFFMPNLIGGLILGYIWKFIFSEAFMTLSQTFGDNPIFRNWLINPDYALYAIVIVFTWQYAGYMMIIYIAGIQGISNDLIEAAKIDGANYWQRLRSIVFPLLMQSFTICLFLTLSFAFKIYDVNLSLTNGGPANATEMFALNIFNEIFNYSNYGYGQAKAIVFFVIVAVITLTQVSITKRREVEIK